MCSGRGQARVQMPALLTGDVTGADERGCFHSSYVGISAPAPGSPQMRHTTWGGPHRPPQPHRHSSPQCERPPSPLLHTGPLPTPSEPDVQKSHPRYGAFRGPGTTLTHDVHVFPTPAFKLHHSERARAPYLESSSFWSPIHPSTSQTQCIRVL